MATSYGFSPKQLSPALWLADKGNDPAIWEDLSGNGRHATQATAANQPAIVTNALNGRQVRRFDGSNDLLLCDFGSTISQPITVFWCGKFNSVSSLPNGRIFHASTSSSSESSVFLPHAVVGSTQNLISNFGTEVSWGSANTQNAIYASTANGSSSTMHRSGVLLSTLNSGTNGCGRYVSIGGRYHDGLRCASADITEILVFATALSTSNRQLIEKYLSIKYNIPLA